MAIFHARGQTRDKKMETICKENTNTISFLLIYGFGAICPFVLRDLEFYIFSLSLFFFSIWIKFSLFFVYLIISIKVLNQTICLPKKTEAFLLVGNLFKD